MAQPSLFDPLIREQGRCHLVEADPCLAPLVEEFGDIHPGKKSTQFHVLSAIIIDQQISTKAAATIRRRLQKYLEGKPTAAKIAALSREEMRELGISRQKAQYLHNLAEAALAGRLNPRQLPHLGNAEISAQIVAIKGLGMWSAEMFLLFGLGRTDIFSPGDLGLQNALRDVYGLRERPNAKKFARLAEPWKPFRSLGCLYLWRSLRDGAWD